MYDEMFLLHTGADADQHFPQNAFWNFTVIE